MRYEPAWHLQKQIQQVLIKAKRAEIPQHVPHVLLLLEHPPVFTLGKSGNPQHLLVTESLLAQRGASFVHIDRGGDITFHGPGQLVGYPILDLDRLSPDIHLYLRNLEEIMIRVCAEYDINAQRVEGKTGVWIKGEVPGAERKICAMGIRCSRWVTMHGFAFNMNTDLSYFDYIVPCGLTNREVTSLARETKSPANEQEVIKAVVSQFSDVFDVQTDTLELNQSMEFLEDLIGETINVTH